MEKTYCGHLRRLSDDELQHEHRERLNAREMDRVMMVLQELDDREHDRYWDRKTSTGRRLSLVR